MYDNSLAMINVNGFNDDSRVCQAEIRRDSSLIIYTFVQRSRDTGIPNPEKRCLHHPFDHAEKSNATQRSQTLQEKGVELGLNCMWSLSTPFIKPIHQPGRHW